VTRMLYNDLLMPLGIEMRGYSDGKKMEASRRVQVLISITSDFLTGNLLLYLFYNNAMHQISKRVKIRRHLKKMNTGGDKELNSHQHLSSMGT
jgi:hypothetical protein